MKMILWLLLCTLAALTLPESTAVAAEQLNSHLNTRLGSALLAGDPIEPGILNAAPDHRSGITEAELGEEPAEDSESALPFAEDFTAHGFKTQTVFTPYLGAGTAPADSDPAISDQEDAGDNYRLAAGIGYELDESTTLDLGYRGILALTPEVGETLEDALTADFADHSIAFGLKTTF